MPLLSKGFPVAKEQFIAGKYVQNFSDNTKDRVYISTNQNEIIFKSEAFNASFNLISGKLSKLDYGSGNIMLQGLAPNFWRATTDNDYGFNMPKHMGVWKEATEKQELVSIKLKDKEKLLDMSSNEQMINFRGNSIALEVIYKFFPNALLE